MKIAIVTNNGQTISQHFGRASHYAIFSIENGEVKDTEMRERHTGHKAQQHEHEHHHDHNNNNAHGIGQDEKHDAMAKEIADCQVLIAGGMGRGAYMRFFQNGINVIMTDITDIKQAVDAYIKGELKNLYIERTH